MADKQACHAFQSGAAQAPWHNGARTGDAPETLSANSVRLSSATNWLSWEWVRLQKTTCASPGSGRASLRATPSRLLSCPAGCIEDDRLHITRAHAASDCHARSIAPELIHETLPVIRRPRVIHSVTLLLPGPAPAPASGAAGSLQ